MPFRPAYDGQFPSLGPQVIAHVEEYLGLELMVEQAKRLVHLYRLDTEGRRVIRRAALRRPKGAGKSPEGGYIGFAEFTGPVVFAGWDANGQPVGRPRDSRRYEEPFAWVQFAAVSEDQTDNVLVWLYEILADRSNTLDDLGIDLGRTRIYLKDRPGRIEPVTAAAGSREGQPITFAALDQTEAWKQDNGGLRLAATMRRNAAKTRGWTYEFQNAPEPGDGSVADLTSKAWEKGQRGVYFDTRVPSEVPDLNDRPALLKALAEAYGESATRGFVSLERQADECTDADTSVSDAYRFYLNIPYATPDTWIDERAWDLLETPVQHDPQEHICAGFSGRLYDGAALIGCKVDTGELFTLYAWEKPGELVPRSEVHAAVERMFAECMVRRFYVDLSQWATEYDTWHLEHGDTVISRPPQQTAKMAYACDRFHAAVVKPELRHDGNAIVRRHVLAARTRKVAAGTLIVPRSDGPADQITGAKAAVLAWEARADVMVEEPPKKKYRAMGF